MGRARSSLLCLAGVVALVASACGVSDQGGDLTSGAESPTTSVIVDGDFGPDDMMALLYLLQRTDVEVLAVTVSGTGLVHCPDGGRNARSILDYVERTDIPVACGSDEPLSGSNEFPQEWRAGSDGFVTQIGLDPYDGPVEMDAPGRMIEAVAQADEPVQLLVLGPMTNLATALDRQPDMADSIAGIVMMGGAFEVNGSVPPDYSAEWNVWVDPTATQKVMAHGVPMTIVPLDATNDVPATRFFVEVLGTGQNTAGARLIYRYFSYNDFQLEGGSYFFWDPLTAVALVRPEIVEFETKQVIVDDRSGATVESPQGVPSRVAVSADRRAFEEELLTVFNDGEFVPADIPEPTAHVRYTGESCTFDGATEYTASGTTATVVVELSNETEAPAALATGLHTGVTWDDLVADANRYQETGVAPSYWVQTGSITLNGKSVTGGSTVGLLDLQHGAHALVCSGEDGAFHLVTDLIVKP